ncbi:glycolate oxidase subunit GlcF [Zavarzinia sp. CC-PAN008]|uniref:glycolate oxidase subunit GlcF n=1 Tax=Zavarzinia sp. CC-PAN008 TaxID=3243332 RepID=UPI003F748992
MRTQFSEEQRADPRIAASEQVLRTCVHCGFCTATCPTYRLLGDERDSPRGRIALIQAMLESDAPPDPQVVTHVDRCLSCLSCMTTCPSGVNYMHLVDHARAHIAEHHTRPLGDRLVRGLLAHVLPHPNRFRLALAAAALGRVAAPVLPARLRAMLDLAPGIPPSPAQTDRPQVFPAVGPKKARVAILQGCVQQVIGPQINAAAIRLLTRAGAEVVVARGAGCCGALVHHMGREEQAKAQARANIAAWMGTLGSGGLDAVVITASGCGTTVKDYGFMLRTDTEWAKPAARIAALARDVTEVVAALGLPPGGHADPLRVAYHAACSLQHGQRVNAPPRALLAQAGFAVQEVPDGHLCCGSAGTYNILQPQIAGALKRDKLAAIATTAPQVVATGNIGCMTQLADGLAVPIVHTVELLDWATGGPRPDALATPHDG